MFYGIIYLCISNVPNPKCLVYSRSQKSVAQINEWMDKWIDWINEAFFMYSVLAMRQFYMCLVSGVPSAWNILLHLLSWWSSICKLRFSPESLSCRKRPSWNHLGWKEESWSYLQSGCEEQKEPRTFSFLCCF